MKLLGRNHLQMIAGIDPEIDRWLRVWSAEIVHAKWKAPLELINQYPSVIYREEGVFLFPVAVTRGVIETVMGFAQGVALITSASERR